MENNPVKIELHALFIEIVKTQKRFAHENRATSSRQAEIEKLINKFAQMLEDKNED